MRSLTANFTKAAAFINNAKPDDIILFVLRHGESLGQIDRTAYQSIGDYYLPLTERGVQQAEASGFILDSLIDRTKLKDVRIISSKGRRSAFTAHEIFDVMRPDHYVSFEYDTDLDKQKFGKFDGLFSSAERKAKCPEEFAKFELQLQQEHGAFYARPPEGESIGDVQKRLRGFFNDVQNRRTPVIAITHGTNALCLEDIPLKRGKQWILDRVDTRPNCAIRLITGGEDSGYRALTISTDPIATVAALVKDGHGGPLLVVS